jgi:DNA-binding NarL/FixJ family response regulator
MVIKDNKPTVVLADDHLGMLDKVTEVLGKEVRIVARVRDGISSVRATQELKPDILLLDVAMPGLNGIEAAREVRRRGLASRIIFLTVQHDADYIQIAREIGASYVLKSKMHTDLLVAIQEALVGRIFTSSSAPAASRERAYS